MPLFDVVPPAFLVLTIVSHTLQGALKDGFSEAIVARNLIQPCKFLSIDSFQKRFLWTHEEVDLALHPDAGLMLQVGDAEKFPQMLGFESLDPFFWRVSKQGPCFTAIKEDGSDKRLIQVELACEADGVASPDPV